MSSGQVALTYDDVSIQVRGLRACGGQHHEPTDRALNVDTTTCINVRCPVSDLTFGTYATPTLSDVSIQVRGMWACGDQHHKPTD